MESNYNRAQRLGVDRTITKTPITDDMRKKALQRAKSQPEKAKSGLGSEADFKGCLGEVIVEFWMKNKDIQFESKLDSTKYDYKLLSSGRTFDVKTKDRNVMPNRGYDCTIPLYNHRHQDADFFIFVSLQKNKSRTKGALNEFEFAYIVGSISNKELDLIGIPYLRDEQDWTNGTVMWTSVLNVRMFQLISLLDTVELFKAAPERIESFLKSREGKAKDKIPIPSVNHKLQFEIEDKISRGKLLERPFPPWTQDKLIKLEQIESSIEHGYIHNPLDFHLIKYRLLNPDLEPDEFRVLLEREGWLVHKFAINDLLKRYNLADKKNLNTLLTHYGISSGQSITNEMIYDVIKSGTSQKEWIGMRKNKNFSI